MYKRKNFYIYSIIYKRKKNKYTKVYFKKFQELVSSSSSESESEFGLLDEFESESEFEFSDDFCLS